MKSIPETLTVPLFKIAIAFKMPLYSHNQNHSRKVVNFGRQSIISNNSFFNFFSKWIPDAPFSFCSQTHILWLHSSSYKNMYFGSVRAYLVIACPVLTWLPILIMFLNKSCSSEERLCHLVKSFMERIADAQSRVRKFKGKLISYQCFKLCVSEYFGIGRWYKYIGSECVFYF